MSKIDRKKYVYAQLKSLPNAFQYVEVTQYIESLENQLKQQSNAIDECIEFVKSKCYEQKADYYDYYEKGACFMDEDYDTLLEKLKQAKGE